MKQLICAFLVFLTQLSDPTSARAEEMLPVAEGRYTVLFVLGKNVPRPQVGSWVSFLGTFRKNVPTRLNVQDGFVLGTRDSVVYVEMSERDAAYLAEQRAQQTIRMVKSRDADPETVADRRRAAEAGQPITLAPRMVTLTVSVPVSKDRVAAWKRGMTLTFVDAHEIKSMRYKDERITSRYYDIRAQFVSATQTHPARFDVTVITNPGEAPKLLRADTHNLLQTIKADGESAQSSAREDRCYITHRRGAERVRVEIPCA